MASRRSSAALALAFAAIISVALPAASAAWRSSMALSSAEHVHVDGDVGEPMAIGEPMAMGEPMAEEATWAERQCRRRPEAR
eukprot:scaffold49610_cov80-Phaeocystis_antarctica.AAC.2